MHYLGPQSADLENVRALNRDFLAIVTGGAPASRRLPQAPPPLPGRLAALRPAQRERLATAPFLLFSLRERDAAGWQRLFDAPAHADLFGPARNDAVLAGLIAAGVGYLWQLARQNPYTARLVCGASVNWCEQLAERPLAEVVRVAAGRADLPVLRDADDTMLWDKLLGDGLSAEREVRRAAQVSALQRVLALNDHRGRGPAALAARRLRLPSLQVADKGDR